MSIRNYTQLEIEMKDEYYQPKTNGYWQSTYQWAQSNLPPTHFEGMKIITKVVGVSFGRRQKVIATLKVGDELYLIREPNNYHDANAIKVATPGNAKVGYLNKYMAARFAPGFDLYAKPVIGQVWRINGGYRAGIHLGVEVSFIVPKIIDVKVEGDSNE